MNRLASYLDLGIDLGFILLLVTSPLVAGSVRDQEQAVMHFLATLIFAMWALKITWGPAPMAVTLRQGNSEKEALGRRRRRELLDGRLVLSGLEWPALAFAVLVGLQLVPLSASLVDYLSPRTTEIVAASRPSVGGEGIPAADLERWILEHPAAEGKLDAALKREKTSLVSGEVLPVTRRETVPLSLDPGATWRSLSTYLSYLMIFIVGVNHWRDRRRANRILWTLVGMTGLMAAYGVGQVVTGDVGMGSWLQDAADGRIPTGPFVNPNHYAGYIEMVLPLTLGIGVGAFQRARARSDSSQRLIDAGERILPQAILIGLISVVAAATMLASRSRGGLLATLSAVALFLVFSLFGEKASLRTVLAGVLVLAVALGVASGFGGEGLWNRYSSLANPSGEPSFAFRLQTAQRTLQMATDFPLAGIGLGSFARVYQMYVPGERVKRTGAAHNDFAQVVAETGIVGTLLVALTLLIFIGRFLLPGLTRRGSGRRHAVHGIAVGCTALLVHSFFDFNLQIYSNGLLFVVLVALLAADRVSRLHHGPKSAAVAPSGG